MFPPESQEGTRPLRQDAFKFAHATGAGAILPLGKGRRIEVLAADVDSVSNYFAYSLKRPCVGHYSAISLAIDPAGCLIRVQFVLPLQNSTAHRHSSIDRACLGLLTRSGVGDNRSDDNGRCLGFADT